MHANTTVFEETHLSNSDFQKVQRLNLHFLEEIPNNENKKAPECLSLEFLKISMRFSGAF